MKADHLPVTFSEIDEERFGITTVKAMAFGPDDIDDVMKFCVQNGVKFLIARCPTSNLKLVQKMEELGFQLMDTLVYYSCNLKKNPPPEYVSEIIIRHFKAGEEDIIRTISAEAF